MAAGKGTESCARGGRGKGRGEPDAAECEHSEAARECRLPEGEDRVQDTRRRRSVISAAETLWYTVWRQRRGASLEGCVANTGMPWLATPCVPYSSCAADGASASLPRSMPALAPRLAASRQEVARVCAVAGRLVQPRPQHHQPPLTPDQRPIHHTALRPRTRSPSSR